MQTDQDYKTTREQCQANIKGVCPYCGGKVEPIETVDNADNPTYWSGCLDCQKYTNAVDAKIYELAKKTQKDFRFNYYSHDDEKEETKINVNYLCGLLSYLKHNNPDQ